MCGPWPPLFAAVREIVEQRHAVGFRPDADFARFSERRVLHIEQMFAIEAKLEFVAREFDTQRVPLAGRDRLLHAVTALASHDIERTALAVHSLVKDHIALERIRPCDVVVVRILCAPDHATGLIFLATDWFE